MKISNQSKVENRKSKAFRLRGCFGSRPSAIGHRHSERGIALVITLILLSVTLIMALAFLAISRRERGSVTTESDTTTARLAADAALAHAEAQIMANIFIGAGNTNNNGQLIPNPYNFSLLVSTNYINYTFAFQPGIANPTNVDYLYANGAPVTGSDFLQNLANLLYLPRVPVYVTTNSSTPPDFRFYLDLNRNGRFDPNGFVPVTDSTGATNGLFSFQVGDPEWIGGLERPDMPHGPNNQFLYRYAFIAVPAGNALDANYIHNQVFDEPASAPPSGTVITMNPGNDGFFRNQGVGSWEINLAAFLTDLNTNEWDTTVAPYKYLEPTAFPNTGVAFDDARALLAYRYANNYASLASVQNLFGNAGATAFQNDKIDGYSDGSLQTTLDTNADFNTDKPGLPWAGADNTNHFFTAGEFFDPTKTGAFVTNLWSAGTSNATYDRYTFYRMLSQLGTDSSPESGKMNINYDNLTVTNNSASETNFIAWTPLTFFTNAADRMLRAYTTKWFQASPTNYLETYCGIVPTYYVDTSGYGVTNVSAFGMTNQVPSFGVTNIPVYVNGQFVYSSAMQRVLQLAANIYDASTTNFYPSIFRPLFTRDVSGNIFISGYSSPINNFVQSGFETNALSTPDLVTPIEVTDLQVGQNILTNIYGVPWIIGAKKGFPNFNEYSTECAVQITRKLQVTRNTNSPPPNLTGTNQMYIMSITNWFGLECWNSYRSNYQGPVTFMVRDTMSADLTNDMPGFSEPSSMINPLVATVVIPLAPSWLGYNGGASGPSFVLPLGTNSFVLWLTNSIYNYGPNSAFGYSAPGFIPTGLNPPNYLNTGTPFLPQFGLLTTNRLQVAIIDYSGGANNGRIVDYVQLGGLDNSRNLSAEISAADNEPPALNNGGVWNSTTNNGVPQGVINQINISKRGGTVPSEDLDTSGNPWSTPDQVPNLSGANQETDEQYFFESFMDGVRVYYGTVNGKSIYVSNSLPSMQVPFTPNRTVVSRTTWQANDPLIHYLASDLTDVLGDTNGQHNIDWPANLGYLNERYMPWGGNPQNGLDQNPWSLSIKDPLVWQSDYWDFPTNKFPTVGWLGRVHRGTPWQTVYLKSSDVLANNNVAIWSHWTGNLNYFDATNAAPVQDRLLFDIFTTAFNDNATRGQLSVNIPSPNLAAWSALFSGVMVLSNNASDSPMYRYQLSHPFQSVPLTNFVINPAGVNGTNSALYSLAAAIDQTRSTFTNTDLLPHEFEHEGDILAVPQLTQQSPFLNISSGVQLTNAISDEMYEWLPQQTMSLLRVGSARYVIYCYGQALKPAPNSIVTSGSLFGMITNYQVVAESATRAVVRFESTITNNTVVNSHAVVESFNVLPPD